MTINNICRPQNVECSQDGQEVMLHLILHLLATWKSFRIRQNKMNKKLFWGKRKLFDLVSRISKRQNRGN